jgi:hypothetical protein
MKALAGACFFAGRSQEALALLAQFCELDPKDTSTSLRLAVWQAWFGQDAEYEATRRRLLEQAESIEDGEVEKALDRAAKAYCLRPATNTVELGRALELAQRALRRAKANDPWRPWYQMALGLAEYRNGQFAAAEQTLSAAERAFPSQRYDARDVARLFRVMSLWRQNRPEEARQLFGEAEAGMPRFPVDEQRPYAERRNLDHEALICWLAYKEARALLKP